MSLLDFNFSLSLSFPLSLSWKNVCRAQCPILMQMSRTIPSERGIFVSSREFQRARNRALNFSRFEAFLFKSSIPEPRNPLTNSPSNRYSFSANVGPPLSRCFVDRASPAHTVWIKNRMYNKKKKKKSREIWIRRFVSSDNLKMVERSENEFEKWFDSKGMKRNVSHLWNN